MYYLIQNHLGSLVQEIKGTTKDARHSLQETQILEKAIIKRDLEPIKGFHIINSLSAVVSFRLWSHLIYGNMMRSVKMLGHQTLASEKKRILHYLKKPRFGKRI